MQTLMKDANAKYLMLNPLDNYSVVKRNLLLNQKWNAVKTVKSVE